MYTKISKKASKKLPSFSCPNPDCPAAYRSFDTVKGYQNHLTHSAVCTEYASRQLSLVQSLACQPTQPIATATIPTAVLDPGISTNSTLYPAYARVNQHDRLNPEYPNGTIPDYQDFQIFGDIEEAAINNEGINVGASTPGAYEDANSTKKRLPRNSTLVPQSHSLEEKAIWKLLVILDSSYGVSRLCI